MTIGLAGLGHVGLAVARLAAAFEMTVWGLRRSGPGPGPSAYVERVFGPDDRLQFFSELDFLVIAMPLTPATRAFVDAEVLRVLPKHAILVNISRGGLVDEDAPQQALVSGRSIARSSTRLRWNH